MMPRDINSQISKMQSASVRAWSSSRVSILEAFRQLQDFTVTLEACQHVGLFAFQL